MRLMVAVLVVVVVLVLFNLPALTGATAASSSGTSAQPPRLVGNPLVTGQQATAGGNSLLGPGIQQAQAAIAAAQGLNLVTGQQAGIQQAQAAIAAAQGLNP